jgi:hypothetical protein
VTLFPLELPLIPPILFQLLLPQNLGGPIVHGAIKGVKLAIRKAKPLARKVRRAVKRDGA